MEEKIFSDDAILEEDIALINNGKKITNGISLVINADGRQIEIVLEREEIKKCLKVLNDEWEVSKLYAK